MKTANVDVNQIIQVTVDETKFTEEFMAEFRKSIFPAYDLDDHMAHLAQMFARGIVDDNSFIEGYGAASQMGIKFKWIDQSEEVQRPNS